MLSLFEKQNNILAQEMAEIRAQREERATTWLPKPMTLEKLTELK